MRLFDNNEYVKNNCTECIYFNSYRNAYEDEYEPDDMGFCLKDKHDNSVDATLTCGLFKKVSDK